MPQYNARQLSQRSNASTLSLSITRSDTGDEIATQQVPVNVSDNQVSFSLGQFKPSLDPYAISVKATVGGKTFNASTVLRRLPTRTDGGSVTKLDNLYGSLLVKGMSNDSNWTPIFPYSFYADSHRVVGEDLTAFAARGYNVLHIVPGGTDDNFTEIFDHAESLGLWIQYDMRHSFDQPEHVVERIREQVERVKTRKNLLLYYTADEPGMHASLKDSMEMYSLQMH